MMRKLSQNKNKTPTLTSSPFCFGSTHPGRMQKQTNKKQKRGEMIHTKQKQTDAKEKKNKLCQLTEGKRTRRKWKYRKSID